MNARVLLWTACAGCLALAAIASCGGAGMTGEGPDGGGAYPDATMPGQAAAPDTGPLDSSTGHFDATTAAGDAASEAGHVDGGSGRGAAAATERDGAADAVVPEETANAESGADGTVGAELDGGVGGEAGADASVPLEAGPDAGAVAEAGPDTGVPEAMSDGACDDCSVGPTCQQSDGAIYVCPAGDDCCASPSPPYPTSCAPSGTCPTGSYAIDCAGATDLPDAGVTGQCSGGQVCCGRVTVTGTGTPPNCPVTELTSSCTAAADCLDDAPTSCSTLGNPYTVRLCTVAGDCQSADNGDIHCCKCTTSPLYICAGTLGPLLCDCMN